MVKLARTWRIPVNKSAVKICQVLGYASFQLKRTQSLFRFGWPERGIDVGKFRWRLRQPAAPGCCGPLQPGPG